MELVQTESESSLLRIRQALDVSQGEINDLQDLDAILDRVLLETRRLTGSDGGSIYLKEVGVLRFGYVQNDSQPNIEVLRSRYVLHDVPISQESIVGYVARTGETMLVADAYRLDPDAPYVFDRTVDDRIRYRTKSVLTVPLKGRKSGVIGVLQLINALDEAGKPRLYGDHDRIITELFAAQAAAAIERAQLTRKLILRMVEMSGMRDPRETGAHVNRVAAYSVEIYGALAATRGLPEEEIERFKDVLRLAAMLHDVGKVAIPDAILKKPGKLTPEEYEVMKTHTLKGAELFPDPTSPLEVMAAEIILNHHQKWDGSGYPGASGKQGREIPLTARIVALADVYDALVSSRCYKKAWPEEKVMDEIRAGDGTHFDPEVVDAFEGIQDVIRAIRQRYP